MKIETSIPQLLFLCCVDWCWSWVADVVLSCPTLKGHILIIGSNSYVCAHSMSLRAHIMMKYTMSYCCFPIICLVSRHPTQKRGSGETVYKHFSARNFNCMTFVNYYIGIDIVKKTVQRYLE